MREETMRMMPEDPPRLSERIDQPDLVERIASQALLDRPPPAQLSPRALARIAATVDARHAPDRRRARLGWVLACTAFLLAFATAASAAHLDLVPAWLSRLVHPGSRLVSHPRPSPTVSSGVSKSRSNLAGAPSLSGPSWVPLADPSAAASVAASSPQVALAEEPAQPAPNLVARGTVLAPPSAKSEGELDGELGQHPRKPRQEGRLGEHGVAKPNPPALAVLTASPMPQPSPVAIETPAFAASPVPQPSPAAVDVPASATSPRPQPSPVAIETPAFAAAPRPATSIVFQTPAPLPRAPAARLASSEGPSFQSGANQTAKHLKQVIQALRVDHSPKNALALLDRHRTELDSSAFREEVLLLRVETLLSLGQRGEVLRLLDGTSLTDVVASRALLITRGELRAAANRCSEGIGDFDLVIAVTRRPPKQALLGRASCREKLGYHVGAQADLDRARREYPGE